MTDNSEQQYFSQEQIQKYKETFSKIDLDHNGVLDQYEFSCFLTSIGLDPRLTPACFKVFDSNHDGTLSFDEFLNYLKHCEKAQTDPRHLYRLIFDAIDQDKNGALDESEIVEFLNLLGIPVTPEIAKEEVQELDKNGNGRVEFEEICNSLGL